MYICSLFTRYLLADRSVFSIPVAMTLLASFLSPITLLGDPAETYVNGGLYLAVIFSNFLLYPTIALFFVPVFYNLEITSVYEVSMSRNRLSPSPIFRSIDTSVQRSDRV